MGCGSCGSGASGKPNGCQSNGGCSSGGCNRLNVFDWLSGLHLPDTLQPFNIIEVTFNSGSRKEFFKNTSGLILEKGEMIAVEGVSGFDVGSVSLTGELVKLQMKKYGVKDDPQMRRVLRLATEEDLEIFYSNKAREQEVMITSRAIAKQLNLDMKVCEVEIQADGKKATFFYTADNRVDFRELIKVFATEFRLKVEMRQIGARQESAKVGGIGSCGRELCCSTWLSDFKTVNTTAARYQNLTINQTKLSGQCGRLKCCLNYELDTYMDALRVFPDNADVLETATGNASLQKKDIFRNLMWYSFRDSSKLYPLTIERVKEILQLNKDGVKPENLQPIELETSAQKKAGMKVDMGFVNDVGQISLKALDKSTKKKPKQNGQANNSNKPNQQPQLATKPQPNKQGNGPKPNQQQPKQAQPQLAPRDNNQAPKQTNAGGQPQRPQRPQQRPQRPQRNPKPNNNPQ